MNIDLDNYTIEELINLNKQVVTRIRFLQKQQQVEAAANFKIGDIVSFLDNENNEQEAMVTHINPKKLRLIALKDQSIWTISPSLLTFVRKTEKDDWFKLFDAGSKARKR